MKVKHLVYLMLLISLLILFLPSNKFGKYEYTELENFHGHITDISTTPNFIVIDIGVYSVIERNNWLHIARMKVTTGNCINKHNIGYTPVTYHDIKENWLIDLEQEGVYGPLTDEEYINFTQSHDLDTYIQQKPANYRVTHWKQEIKMVVI